MNSHEIVLDYTNNAHTNAMLDFVLKCVVGRLSLSPEGHWEHNPNEYMALTVMTMDLIKKKKSVTV